MIMLIINFIIGCLVVYGLWALFCIACTFIADSLGRPLAGKSGTRKER